MRVLEFIVTGQNIKKNPECDFDDIVAGSIGYLKASFEFSVEWGDCKKVVNFWNDDDEKTVSLDESNTCVIPASVLTRESFFVSVAGTRNGYRIVSADTKVIQKKNKSIEVNDNTLTIDLNTRDINIPKSITNIGVSSDDDVCRLHFEVPRYFDEIDLSTFDIRVNYMNAKGKGDVYDVMSFDVIDNMIYFDWLVGRHAVAYHGDVYFIVCFKDVDDGGKVLREFNTAIATLPVLQGLETGTAVVTEHSDLLEQWKKELENHQNNISKSRVGDVTLLASEWTGDDNLYSQIVSIDGVTKRSQVDLTPSVEQLVVFYEKDLTFVTENDGGVVTVYAIGQKPANDYTIQVTLTEVAV